MPKLILITGGSASGKTTVAHHLSKQFGDQAIFLSQDNFYKPKGNTNTNYDVPGAFDYMKQKEVLEKLLNNQSAVVPKYNFENHERDGEFVLQPADVIIFEGLFVCDHQSTADMASLKIFVDTPSDTRLGRRMIRDVNERGRKMEDVYKRWLDDVQPSYTEYIEKQKKKADIIIPWSAINKKSLSVLFNAIAHADK